MTAREALEQTTAAQPGERLSGSKRCAGRGGWCERAALTHDPGRWTWCAACLTVYDDYGTPVNPIPEYTKVH